MDETLFEIHPITFRSLPPEKVFIATRNALTSLVVPGARFILMDSYGVEGSSSDKLVSLWPTFNGIVIHVWVRGDDNVYRETACVDIDENFIFSLSIFKEIGDSWRQTEAKVHI